MTSAGWNDRGEWKPGPRTAEARAPRGGFGGKRGRKVGEPLCSVCCQPEPLTRGRCTDRAACLERAPQLDLGLP